METAEVRLGVVQMAQEAAETDVQRMAKTHAEEKVDWSSAEARLKVARGDAGGAPRCSKGCAEWVQIVRGFWSLCVLVTLWKPQ